MPCNPEILNKVPLFALLDPDETAFLASQVDVRKFSARQRIWKMNDVGGRAYVLVSGSVRVTTTDQDNQEVIVDEPAEGQFFGFASMLEQTPHQTDATALEESVCLEVDREDIAILLEKKPHAGMDMLTVLGRQFHATQQLVRLRANRNANEVIEEAATWGGEHRRRRCPIRRFVVVHHHVWRGAGDVYGDQYRLGEQELGSLSVHLAEFVPVDVGGDSGAGDHDEPEPAGQKRPVRSELDFDVNKRAASDIQGLARKLNLLGEKIGDVEDLIRERVEKKN